jgi:hypothetical protein
VPLELNTDPSLHITHQRTVCGAVVYVCACVCVSLYPVGSLSLKDPCLER